MRTSSTLFLLPLQITRMLHYSVSENVRNEF